MSDKPYTDAEVTAATVELQAWGADSDSTVHASWRCFDKERYPEPCTCIDQMTRDILDAVAPAIAARALLTEAEWWKDIPHTNLTGPLVSDVLIYHARFGLTGWIPVDERARAEETEQ